MTRPAYQSNKDTEHEVAFMERLRARGFQIDRLKSFYPCDFLISKGGVIALAEYKRRRVLQQTYPTIILSVHKFTEIKVMAQMIRSKFLFYVEFDDGLCVADLTEHQPEPGAVKIGGRTDRGDAADMEPVIEIPIEIFKK